MGTQCCGSRFPLEILQAEQKCENVFHSSDRGGGGKSDLKIDSDTSEKCPVQ